MTLTKTGIVVVATCSLALSSGAALGAASATANVGSFAYQLFDLDPLDGVTSAITFNSLLGGGNNGYVSSYVNSIDTYFSDTKPHISDVLASIARPTGQTVSAAVQGAATLGGIVVSATGTTFANFPETTNSFYGQSSSTDWYFTISPKTLALFTATTNLTASTTGLGYESASAEGLLRVAGKPQNLEATLLIDGGGGSSDGSQESSSFKILEVYGTTGGLRLGQFTLAVAYTNTSTEDLAGYVGANTYISGYSEVTAVPEPHTWAMLLAGVGLLGGIAARRRQRG